MIASRRHSSAQGDCPTRGGRASSNGAGSSPAAIISLTPRGNSLDVSTISLRRLKVARLHTNSLVSSTKISESFGPSLENKTIGGWSETPLKNGYGARLISTLALMEVIQTIGRGG